MNISEEYMSRLCTAEEAVRLVKSGEWVDYGSGNSFPVSLDAALAQRKDELRGVKLRGNLIPGPIMTAECDPLMEHFVYNTWHCSSYERRLCDAGRAFFSPMLFRNLSWYYREFLSVDTAMLSVSPMDDEGYFSFSGASGAVCFIADKAKKVILEVNEALPRMCGGPETKIHITRADAVVEAGFRPLWEMPVPEPAETDMKIAESILPYIHDGNVLQLGIGGIPSVLGRLIARSELKDLGMHTELCSDAYLELAEAGKLTNKNSLIPGKGITGLAMGSARLYDWIRDNDAVQARDLGYVNSVNVISSVPGLISINSCISIDLYGQISSESAGLRQISGTGGQLDFVTGATASPGGKSFICLQSCFTDKKGVSHSTIVPHFNGEIITTPRAQAYYVATEYGAVNLAGRTTWERADALISVAAPEFREELIREAEKQRIWLPSNKR